MGGGKINLFFLVSASGYGGPFLRFCASLSISSIGQYVWWSLLLDIRCLWRHNMTP